MLGDVHRKAETDVDDVVGDKHDEAVAEVNDVVEDVFDDVESDVDMFFEFLLLGFCNVIVATSPRIVDIWELLPSPPKLSLNALNRLLVDTDRRGN